jgi:ABC-type sugar transport system substrate-binding protein
MGRVAVESAVKVIRGETVPPDINVKLELVTKDTVK